MATTAFALPYGLRRLLLASRPVAGDVPARWPQTTAETAAATMPPFRLVLEDLKIFPLGPLFHNSLRTRVSAIRNSAWYYRDGVNGIADGS